MKIEVTGLPVLLFVVFLVLKLCHVIDWSWWWVTMPLWITIAICVSCFLLAGFLWVINKVYELFTR